VTSPNILELLKLAQKGKLIADAVQKQGLHLELPPQARAAIAEFEGVDLSKYQGGYAPPDAPKLEGGGSIL
jgi:hypothetical protein